MGANAVIHTTYRQQVTWTSWFSMGGQGLAVVAESEYVTCPELRGTRETRRDEVQALWRRAARRST